MAKPIAINLLLLDGKTSGLVKCSIDGRTEIIFKIPRKDLTKCKEREELKGDGVYFLLGEENGRPKIYVGQAGSRKNGTGILTRLKEHDRAEKNFWTEAIVFTTSDKSFGATEISWLENKFCNMAMNAARYTVSNGNDPSPGNITEAKEIVLNDHAEFAQLMLSAMGYKMFEPLPKVEPQVVDAPDEEIFKLERSIKKLGRKVTAYMKITPTGFKVLAGSAISPIDSDNLSIPAKNRRHSAKLDANGILLEEIEFSSSSTAAEFVVGNNANGRESWKTHDGEPLKNFL